MFSSSDNADECTCAPHVQPYTGAVQHRAMTRRGPQRKKPLTSFGVALERELAASGLFENNLTALCEAAGTSYRTVYNYMVKGVDPPSSIVAALAQQLNIPTDRLVRAGMELVRDGDAGPAWEQFVQVSKIDELTPAERAWLRSAPFRGGAKSGADYTAVLVSLLRLDQLPRPDGLHEAEARASGASSTPSDAKVVKLSPRRRRGR